MAYNCCLLVSLKNVEFIIFTVCMSVGVGFTGPVLSWRKESWSSKKKRLGNPVLSDSLRGNKCVKISGDPVRLLGYDLIGR